MKNPQSIDSITRRGFCEVAALSIAASAFGQSSEKTKRASASANFPPIGDIHAHVCGIHFYSGDMSRQIIAEHYCSHLSDEVLQCILYDSNKPGARLIGIEYIVSDHNQSNWRDPTTWTNVGDIEAVINTQWKMMSVPLSSVAAPSSSIPSLIAPFQTAAGQPVTPVLSYLANAIRIGEHETPYSLVVAIDPAQLPKGATRDSIYLLLSEFQIIFSA